MKRLFLSALLILLVAAITKGTRSGNGFDISHSESPFNVSGSAQHQNKLYIIKEKKWLYSKDIQKMIRSASHHRGLVQYSTRHVRDFTASATGMDGLHHIVNSYLVGYMPFKPKNVWTPWHTLAKRKKYQSDQLSPKNGTIDEWQTSREAHEYPYGDCEDHSIALADWLIGMGKDARVVIGSWNGEGHAWVVLILNGRQYILESTLKQGFQNMRTLPLARLQQGYCPKYMFNRNGYWKNAGSSLTSDYTSSRWEKMSRYY